MTDNRGRNGSRDSRVPPFNEQAEASLLGAALLSRTAMESMVASTTAADFYKPSHQHIAAAIGQLAEDPDPVVDVVTVAEQLRRNGLLDEIGGVGYLVDLQNATPSTSSAPRYARIIKDAAILRRLIATAADIAELGYLAGDDPSAAVVRAGELLNRMDTGDAAALSTLEVADLAALLANNLQTEQATLLTRSDGGGLLYAGKTHMFQAEPSAGKSWIGLAATAEVLAMGGAAAYLDYEDSPAGVTGRLINLSVPEKVIAERFMYAQPTGRFGPAEKVRLWEGLDRLNPDLVIIDGVGAALQREGLNEDKAPDFLHWYEMLPRPIAATGAAVLMLDHVSKDPEQRGRWARGTGAKLAAIDGASYQIKVRIPFSRHRSGKLDIVIAKDRPGGVGAIGETAATVHVEPRAAGDLVTIRLEPHATDQAPTDSWKPTVLMGKVHRALDESTVPLTAGALAALVHSDKPRLVKEAIARLIAEGYIAETAKRPKTLRIVRPYDGIPAPPWREEPPPPLFEYEEHPTAEDLAELDRNGAYYNHDQF